MWLDKDQESFSARRAGSLAMLTGLPVRYVHTVNDPKQNSLDKIREIVYDA
jgi:hypothetical protein